MSAGYTMTEDMPAEIADIDGARLLHRLHDRVEGRLFALAEYDTERLNLLYVDDAAREMYPSEESMYEHFETIHSYVHVDFAEIELFTDELFPSAETVEYVVTAMDFLTIIRVYRGDVGIFLSVSPDEPVLPLVAAVRAELNSD